MDVINLTEVSYIVALGAVNFWIGNQSDFFDFFDSYEKDEKYSLCLILGLINWYIYSEILMVYCNKFNHALVLLGSIVILNFLVWLFHLIVNKIRNKKDNRKIYKSILTDAIESVPNSEKYCYVFDFENNLIEHGYMRAYSNKPTETDAFYLIPSLKAEEEIDFKTIRKAFNKENQFIYIDYQNKIKIYIDIFPQDSE